MTKRAKNKADHVADPAQVKEARGASPDSDLDLTAAMESLGLKRVEAETTSASKKSAPAKKASTATTKIDKSTTRKRRTSAPKNSRQDDAAGVLMDGLNVL